MKLHSTLHFRDEGAGEPAVVLVHAFPLHSGMWDAQVQTLCDRWRVITPDLQGFGLSPAPADRAAYSMKGYADDVADLLDELGIERAVVGGLSMGGYVSFAMMRHHPERVTALVLADTRAAADTPEGAAMRIAQQREAAESGTAGIVEGSLANLLNAYTHEHRPEVVARARALMETISAAGLIGGLEAMRTRPDALDELPDYDLPALVIVGEDDHTSPVSEAEQMAKLIPGARLEVIANAAHLSNLEEPDAFNLALTAFLEEVSHGG